MKTQTHFANGFVRHRIFREQHYTALQKLFTRQSSERDFEKFCRVVHCKRLDRQKGVQLSMLKERI